MSTLSGGVGAVQPVVKEFIQDSSAVVRMPHDAKNAGFLPPHVATDRFVTFLQEDTTLESHHPITDQEPPPPGCFFDAGVMFTGQAATFDLGGCPGGTLVHYSCYIHFKPDGTPAMLGTISIV